MDQHTTLTGPVPHMDLHIYLWLDHHMDLHIPLTGPVVHHSTRIISHQLPALWHLFDPLTQLRLSRASIFQSHTYGIVVHRSHHGVTAWSETLWSEPLTWTWLDLDNDIQNQANIVNKSYKMQSCENKESHKCKILRKPIFDANEKLWNLNLHPGMWRTGSTCTCWARRWRTSSSPLPTPTFSSTTSRTVIRSGFIKTFVFLWVTVFGIFLLISEN